MKLEPDDAMLALSSAGDAIVTVNLSGHITSWNEAAHRQIGHRSDQAIGQSLALIIPDLYQKRHIAGFRKAMQRGRLAHQGAPARVEATKGDGSTVVLAMTLGLLTGPDGTPMGAVAVLRAAVADLVPFAPPSSTHETTPDPPCSAARTSQFSKGQT